MLLLCHVKSSTPGAHWGFGEATQTGCVDGQGFCKFTANSAVGHGPGTNQTSSYVPGIVGACQVFVAPYLDWPVATHNNSFFAKHFEHVVYRIEYIRRTWTDHRIY